MSKHHPGDIIQARRCKGYGTVENPEYGIIHEGDIIPMRYEEAEARADFEVVDEPEPAEPEQSEPEAARASGPTKKEEK